MIDSPNKEKNSCKESEKSSESENNWKLVKSSGKVDIFYLKAKRENQLEERALYKLYYWPKCEGILYEFQYLAPDAIWMIIFRCIKTSMNAIQNISTDNESYQRHQKATTIQHETASHSLIRKLFRSILIL